MAYAMFRCCVTANHLPEFDSSTDALVSRLGVEPAEIPEFGCCGYPLKNIDMMASLASSARNLALAEREGKSILTACACCYGTLQHAARLLEDKALLAKANEVLAPERLSYRGTAVVRHLFHLLKENVGINHIERKAGTAHAFKNIAIQYGCKLLRPNLPVESEAPNSEAFFEQLVNAAGAAVVDWELGKDCCGSGISTTDQTLANSIRQAKMIAAQRVAADGVVAACPFCMLQLRKAAPDANGVKVLSISQLLCLALGIDGRIAKEGLEVEHAAGQS
jgi:heterodisulfide reductase subunit B